MVITADNTINAMYDPAETVAAYQRSAGNVAAYAQILGTPQSLAVFQQGDIIANNSVVMPATWYSGWGFTSVDNGQVLKPGVPAVLAGQYTRARARYARWNISSVPSGHYTQGRDTHAGIASGNASSTVSYLQFLQSIEKAIAVRTLESLARIELGAQGGALVERVTTTRTAKDGTATTTVRERFTAPDWHADGWFGLVSADGVRPARPRSGEGG